jgi:hypothetical protein
MRGLLLAVSLASLATTPALAVDDSVMSTRFGNTEIVDTSLGEAHMYFKPDHTFTGTASALIIHLSLKGVWKIDGDTICLNYESPPPGESNPSCSTIANHAIGDTWDSKGRKITLVKGIQ